MPLLTISYRRNRSFNRHKFFHERVEGLTQTGKCSGSQNSLTAAYLELEMTEKSKC
jgi:hypothetical protein